MVAVSFAYASRERIPVVGPVRSNGISNIALTHGTAFGSFYLVLMPATISLKPRQLALAIGATAGGGFVGTLLRAVLTGMEHLPSPSGQVTWPQEIPWVLLVINFVGVYLATRLLRGVLRHRDPNDVARVLVVTGFLGGLTSYSGLYTDLASIWHVSVGGCLTVTVGAVASGVFAGWLGLQWRHR